MQPILHLRTTVRNNAREDAFCHRHRGFRAADDHRRATTAAA